MDIFMQWLAVNSLKGAVLIIAVFLVQFVFSKQIPQKWKYLMWMLVAVRLVMPALFESDSSIFNLQKIWQTEKINSVQEAAPLRDQTVMVDTSIQQAAPVNIAAPEPEIELSTVVFYVWAAAAFLLFLYLIWKNLRLLALVRKEKTVIESRWLSLLENCKRELKLYTPIQLIETRHVSTPALMGFIRPRILLPEGILETMNESEMKLVFMHELTHLKSGDIIINWIISLIQIIHWFNPFVWLAFAKAREARELACDDRMLSFLGKDESKKYGLTIIRLLDLCCNENRITGMVGILENKKQISRRIEMIRNPIQKPK
jgi:bla regulator protein BlaR1